MPISRPKLLFFVAVDWFFCSHFISRAKAASQAGYDVVVLTHVDHLREAIESAGLRLIPLSIDRRSLNPFSALITLMCIYRVYRSEQPELVHHVALKPILFGSVAARLTGVTHVVNAVVGGGYTFTSKRLLMRLVRPLLQAALRVFLNPPRSKVVFENQDDLTAFIRAKQVRQEDAVLIRGAGVDPARYKSAMSVSDIPVVVLAARLLWDKGIGEFVEAARIVRAQGIIARFVIVGDVDPGNRASISRETLTRWREDNVVELWGFRADMPEVFAHASIACLPSYREGLPKVLLEAMAASLPCVTTDVPGCREAVRNGDNGLLIPSRDAQALAEALKLLILDPETRHKMGVRGRQRLEQEFSSDLVIEQTLALYKELISG